MKIPFADWRPDLAELDSGFAMVAENVQPGLNSYVPVRGAAAYSTATAEAPRGLCMAQTQDGNFGVFIGYDDKLLKLNSSTLAWDTLASGFSLPADELWSFAPFGTRLLAAQINNAVQTYDLEAGGTFGDLTGSPPQARIVDTIEGHVFLGSLSSSTNSVAWSGIENATQWTPGSNGSDVQEFKDGGRVMNLAGAAGLIIQERAIRRVIHQPGDPVSFIFDKLEDAKGTIAPYSVIKFGSAIAYLAEDGFWFNGEPIGKDKIDNWFFSEVNQQRLFSVLGTYDPLRPLFYWAYRTGDTDEYDRMLVYNWKTGRWSVVSISLYMISNIATPGVSLEGLDALYPDLDVDVPYSLDSRVWLGGRPTFGVIGTDLKLSFFEGATLEATIETGETQMFAERRAMIKSVRPLVDTTAAVARVGKRERQGDTRTWGAESAMQASGACPVRSSGRYHRYRIRIPAGSTWNHATGVEVTGVALGVR